MFRFNGNIPVVGVALLAFCRGVGNEITTSQASKIRCDSLRIGAFDVLFQMENESLVENQI